MDYSPFNPLVWGLFLGFAVFCWLAVKIFFARNPNYPGKMPGKREEEQD